ncbi:MAG: hypothetical protein Q7T54_03090 [Candidatus Levybacteria bacterium]|nr:hypothetical protein [Candidatus Levybacteria bacterium]
MIKSLFVVLIVIVAIGITFGVYRYYMTGTLPYFQTTSTPQVTNQIPKPSGNPIGLPAGKFRVAITPSGFMPPVISIEKGDTIIWINQSASKANVSSDPHPSHSLFPFLNLGAIEKDGSKEAKFDTEGTFTYHNHLNPNQKGTVIVKSK